MTLLIWLIVGLVAGLLASFITGSKAGIVGDVIVGMVGSIVGGAILAYVQTGQIDINRDFTKFDLTSLLVSTLGAIVLMVIIRIIKTIF